MANEEESNDSKRIQISAGNTINNSPISTGDPSFINLITPENVAMLVSMIGAAVGVTTTAIKGIQVWAEERKSRKIKIRYENMEIEICGSPTEEEIEKKIKIFCDMHRSFKKEDVKIIIEE